MAKGNITTHEGWPQHLIAVRRRGQEPALCYVEKSAGVSVQWRPNPKEFRILDATGIVEDVRYIQRRGVSEIEKLIFLRTRKGAISIDEKALLKIIPVNEVLVARHGS